MIADESHYFLGQSYQAPSEARGVVIGGPEYVKSCRTLLIDSEMAGPIKLELGGMVEGIAENVLAKKFF